MRHITEEFMSLISKRDIRRHTMPFPVQSRSAAQSFPADNSCLVSIQPSPNEGCSFWTGGDDITLGTVAGDEADNSGFRELPSSWEMAPLVVIWSFTGSLG